MEYYSKEQGLLEELLGLREMEYYTNQDFSGYNKSSIHTSSCFQDLSLPIDQNLNCTFYSLPDLPLPAFSSDSSNTLPYYNSCSVFADEDGIGNGFLDLDKAEPPIPELPSCNHESGRKSKVKKLNGQPSKNLMAERRRRKRLNDRLSMLRSVVPKISKMDRASILGDTIDYMKEMLHTINSLQEEMNLGENALPLGLLTIFKNAKPEEIFIRNSPKFEVERKNSETRIDICCGGKTGLLLSTVTTLEALGIDIEQCVISCFNDFAMTASCSEDVKQRAVLDSVDIRQALLRNAGYGGRCL